MKEKRDTIIGVELNHKRASGNTTRQVDHAIQLLFNGYIVQVRDHYKTGRDHMSNRFLLNAIMNRIHGEHRHVLEKVKVNESFLELELEE